jgi:5-methylcytosine-specific restriction endonuclease McrA
VGGRCGPRTPTVAPMAVAMTEYVNGRRVQAFNAEMFAIYGRHCHLCGQAGADTADHLIPVSVWPEGRWVISNVRPAHRDCNSQRQAAPLADTWDAGW